MKKTNKYSLLIITFLSGLLIAGFYQLLHNQIEETKQKNRMALQKSFFPDAATFNKMNENAYEAVDNKGEIIGYIVYGVSDKGYGGKVNVIVALDENKKIKDFLMIEHNETPGLGINVNKDYFKKGFLGKSPNSNELPLIKDDFITKLGIYPVSGATYSSLAISDAIIDAGKKVFKENEEIKLDEKYSEYDDIFFIMEY